MPPVSKDSSNTFLEHSFICAAPYEWNKLSEHIRTSNFDCFRKSIKTILFTQQYGSWLELYILWLFMMWSLLIIVYAFCYIVHWTRTSMYIGYWTLNQYYYYYYLASLPSRESHGNPVSTYYQQISPSYCRPTRFQTRSIWLDARNQKYLSRHHNKR